MKPLSETIILLKCDPNVYSLLPCPGSVHVAHNQKLVF